MFKADWLLPLPAGLDQHQAMCNGTAGLTAVSLLAALGYQVAALTGRHKEQGGHTDRLGSESHSAAQRIAGAGQAAGPDELWRSAVCGLRSAV